MLEEMIVNRLKKNHRKILAWAKRFPTEAFRLYDRDIPEFPYSIEIFKDWAVIHEKGKLLENEDHQAKREAIAVGLEKLGFQSERMSFKVRQKQKGLNQYQQNTDLQESEEITIKENGVNFLIKPKSYIDNGLFLDHRNLRKKVYQSSDHKKVLNLFCYTGSFSVFAALGGARQVTSVDLSNTYLDWSQKNFLLNNLNPSKYEFLKEDVFQFLKQEERFWDLIILDPPSFSNSKSFQGSFDIQRDHAALVSLCYKRLNSGGDFYFSTNKKKFQLDTEHFTCQKLQEISLKTLPDEFRKQQFIHRCFHLKKE